MKKVLGIGNALVDIMTQLTDEDILTTFGLPKGSMQLSEHEFTTRLLQATRDMEKSQSSGGSAANTIHGLAVMGVDTGFIGKVGEDSYGEFFSNDMRQQNINPLLLTTKTESGRAIALITPDSERTFATYLGAAIELTAADLLDAQFAGYDYLHIEGYLVQNHDLMLRAAELAKKQGIKISLDMASFNVVEDNLDFLIRFVRDYVDILFANEEEARAFTGKEPAEALGEIAKEVEIAIVKVGKNGSLIQQGQDVFNVPSIESKPIDTTGAGDLYASGFFYGLVHDKPLDECGRIGTILAGNVIEVIGSKMDATRWDRIKAMI